MGNLCYFVRVRRRISTKVFSTSTPRTPTQQPASIRKAQPRTSPRTPGRGRPRTASLMRLFGQSPETV